MAKKKTQNMNKSARDNRADQLNRNNEKFRKSRDHQKPKEK